MLHNVTRQKHVSHQNLRRVSSMEIVPIYDLVSTAVVASSFFLEYALFFVATTLVMFEKEHNMSPR